jgi:hypothetical protein
LENFQKCSNLIIHELGGAANHFPLIKIRLFLKDTPVQVTISARRMFSSALQAPGRHPKGDGNASDEILSSLLR